MNVHKEAQEEGSGQESEEDKGNLPDCAKDRPHIVKQFSMHFFR